MESYEKEKAYGKEKTYEKEKKNCGISIMYLYADL